MRAMMNYSPYAEAVVHVQPAMYMSTKLGLQNCPQ